MSKHIISKQSVILDHKVPFDPHPETVWERGDTPPNREKSFLRNDPRGSTRGDDHLIRENSGNRYDQSPLRTAHRYDQSPLRNHKCIIGPGVMVSTKDICVLEKKNNCINAYIGYKIVKKGLFTDDINADRHFARLANELTYINFISIDEFVLISKLHIDSIYYEPIYKLSFICGDKYAGEQAIFHFKTDFKWFVRFGSKEDAIEWINPIIESITNN